MTGPWGMESPGMQGRPSVTRRPKWGEPHGFMPLPGWGAGEWQGRAKRRLRRVVDHRWCEAVRPGHPPRHTEVAMKLAFRRQFMIPAGLMARRSSSPLPARWATTALIRRAISTRRPRFTAVIRRAWRWARGGCTFLARPGSPIRNRFAGPSAWWILPRRSAPLCARQPQQ